MGRSQTDSVPTRRFCYDGFPVVAYFPVGTPLENVCGTEGRQSPTDLESFAKILGDTAPTGMRRDERFTGGGCFASETEQGKFEKRFECTGVPNFGLAQRRTYSDRDCAEDSLWRTEHETEHGYNDCACTRPDNLATPAAGKQTASPCAYLGCDHPACQEERACADSAHRDDAGGALTQVCSWTDNHQCTCSSSTFRRAICMDGSIVWGYYRSRASCEMGSANQLEGRPYTTAGAQDLNSEAGESDDEHRRIDGVRMQKKRRLMCHGVPDGEPPQVWYFRSDDEQVEPDAKLIDDRAMCSCVPEMQVCSMRTDAACDGQGQLTITHFAGDDALCKRAPLSGGSEVSRSYKYDLSGTSTLISPFTLDQCWDLGKYADPPTDFRHGHYRVVLSCNELGGGNALPPGSKPQINYAEALSVDEASGTVDWPECDALLAGPQPEDFNVDGLCQCEGWMAAPAPPAVAPGWHPRARYLTGPAKPEGKWYHTPFHVVAGPTCGNSSYSESRATSFFKPAARPNVFCSEVHFHRNDTWEVAFLHDEYECHEDGSVSVKRKYCNDKYCNDCAQEPPSEYVYRNGLAFFPGGKGQTVAAGDVYCTEVEMFRRANGEQSTFQMYLQWTAEAAGNFADADICQAPAPAPALTPGGGGGGLTTVGDAMTCSNAAQTQFSQKRVLDFGEMMSNFASMREAIQNAIASGEQVCFCVDP